jgi:hypothetical protein
MKLSQTKKYALGRNERAECMSLSGHRLSNASCHPALHNRRTRAASSRQKLKYGMRPRQWCEYVTQPVRPEGCSGASTPTLALITGVCGKRTTAVSRQVMRGRSTMSMRLQKTHEGISFTKCGAAKGLIVEGAMRSAWFQKSRVKLFAHLTSRAHISGTAVTAG